ncbi:hypothetical protein EVAR_4784_1 [Eumeta japonica]|uniref:Uncharacterized protein n=1 Tax=Eumeta variegata TaxID=151549 RepID=A0A4C1SZQ6_EUMVA|nr:hypothetical protein EVAR_4784_1 [Eumeta japonica]
MRERMPCSAPNLKNATYFSIITVPDRAARAARAARRRCLRVNYSVSEVATQQPSGRAVALSALHPALPPSAPSARSESATRFFHSRPPRRGQTSCIHHSSPIEH